MNVPERWINKIWKLVIVIGAIYVALYLPFDLIFLKDHTFYNASDWLITLIFSIDAFYNIQNYYKFKKGLNLNNATGDLNYIRALLVMDVLAAIPFGLILYPDFFILFRLLKLARVMHILRQYRQNHIKYTNQLLFLFFIFWVIHIIHWISCGWTYIRGLDPAFDITTNYINSLYWTVTTLTTVGYGDILPDNNIQKVYAMGVQITGFGVFGFLIGSIASVLLKKDPAKTRYQENIESLASLIHYRKIPAQLQKRIVDFYTFMWKQRLGYDETNFLNSLPENLRTEVAFNLKKEVIESLSLFREAGKDFQREIALHLKPVFLTPGDYVFRAGDRGDEMYFVLNGELKALTQKEDIILTVLNSGDFFGEIALVKNKNRSATVKAMSYCDVYVLSKSSYDQVISKYSGIASKIEKQIEIRESRYAY